MSFWEHLDALRGVLIKIAVVLVVAAVALFIWMPDIFDRVIMAPCTADFALYRWVDRLAASIPGMPTLGGDFHVDLINIQLASQLYIHLSTSFWLAVVLTFPILLYLLWTFIAPALYQNERRGVRRAFFFGVAMFYLGVAVGYYVVFPIILRFLADYHVSALVPNQVSLDSYMDTFLMMVFFMGVVFELPLLCWLLGNVGVLHRNFFARYRRHAIVALVVLAAMITPTGDLFTLAVVFVPLYILYEVSALLVPRNDNP
ncbi:MAG: twin-arginine translocase subunit TatC [Muribaculaceae bacterium]|nr:twin-arginine translocase subunit TatC [Muribaculaceae bacterium]